MIKGLDFAGRQRPAGRAKAVAAAAITALPLVSMGQEVNNSSAVVDIAA